MFIAISRYVADLAEVDRSLPEHREWVVEGYRSGRILVSGRREPPVGGVIVAHADDAVAMHEFLSLDPFARLQLAEYEICGFHPTDFPSRSPGFDAFLPAVV